MYMAKMVLSRFLASLTPTSFGLLGGLLTEAAHSQLLPEARPLNSSGLPRVVLWSPSASRRNSGDKLLGEAGSEQLLGKVLPEA
jgi:hypothetical protein